MCLKKPFHSHMEGVSKKWTKSEEWNQFNHKGSGYSWFRASFPKRPIWPNFSSICQKMQKKIFFLFWKRRWRKELLVFLRELFRSSPKKCLNNQVQSNFHIISNTVGEDLKSKPRTSLGLSQKSKKKIFFLRRSKRRVLDLLLKSWSKYTFGKTCSEPVIASCG